MHMDAPGRFFNFEATQTRQVELTGFEAAAQKAPAAENLLPQYGHLAATDSRFR
jgi:hypothetical protein